MKTFCWWLMQVVIVHPCLSFASCSLSSIWDMSRMCVHGLWQRGMKGRMRRVGWKSMIIVIQSVHSKLIRRKYRTCHIDDGSRNMINKSGEGWEVEGEEDGWEMHQHGMYWVRDGQNRMGDRMDGWGWDGDWCKLSVTLERHKKTFSSPALSFVIYFIKLWQASHSYYP